MGLKMNPNATTRAYAVLAGELPDRIADAIRQAYRDGFIAGSLTGDRCPDHGSFVLDLEGVRHCNFRNCEWTNEQLEGCVMEDRYVAIIEHHDYTIRRAVLVPKGQSLEFDEGAITRGWLHPYLGRDWHLKEFLKIEPETT